MTTEEQAEALFREGWRLLDMGRDQDGCAVLLQAAKLGHTEAQQSVGYLRDIGRGVGRSRRAALFWYRKAARAGDSAAAGNIGILYREAKNLELARRWLRRAVTLGHTDMLLELARLEAATRVRRPAALEALRALLAAENIAEATREEARALLARLRGEKEARFLNVDLDLSSTSSLDDLLDALGPQVVVLHRTARRASLELSRQPKSAEDAIRRFVRLAQRLRGKRKVAWQRCSQRVANIGLQAGSFPHSLEFPLSAQVLRDAAKVSLGLAITLYSPHES